MKKEFKIRWIVNAVRIGDKGKLVLNLGFCEKTMNVAFISVLDSEDHYEQITPFVIRDVYVNNECEDGTHCWELECTHNKATPESLKKYLGKKCDYKTFKAVSEKLQDCGKRLISKIDWSKDGTIILTQTPIVISRKPKTDTA